MCKLFFVKSSYSVKPLQVTQIELNMDSVSFTVEVWVVGMNSKFSNLISFLGQFWVWYSVNFDFYWEIYDLFRKYLNSLRKNVKKFTYYIPNFLRQVEANGTN